MTTIFELPPQEDDTTPEDKLQRNVKAFRDAHRDTDNDEPDWQGMVRNAKDLPDRWRIMAAREVWQQEKKMQAWEGMKASEDARIEAITRSPNRCKDFYDNLQKTDPRAYWSVPIQRQKKADRAQMGMSFLLKSRG